MDFDQQCPVVYRALGTLELDFWAIPVDRGQAIEAIRLILNCMRD
jgi:hypothetical protein